MSALPPPSSANPAPLAFLLHWTGKCVDEAMESAAGYPALSIAQAKFLRHLVGKAEGLPLAELADLAGCTRANVTQMLARLEAACLTEKRNNPLDARSVCAVMTPTGEQAFRLAERKLMSFERRLTAGLGKADAERLWLVLQSVIQAL